jgi:hypothetical protein
MPFTWIDQTERYNRTPITPPPIKRPAGADLPRNVYGRVAQGRLRRAIDQVNWWGVLLLAIVLLSTATVITLAGKVIGWIA